MLMKKIFIVKWPWFEFHFVLIMSKLYTVKAKGALNHSVTKNFSLYICSIFQKRYEPYFYKADFCTVI